MPRKVLMNFNVVSRRVATLPPGDGIPGLAFTLFHDSSSKALLSYEINHRSTSLGMDCDNFRLPTCLFSSFDFFPSITASKHGKQACYDLACSYNLNNIQSRDSRKDLECTGTRRYLHDDVSRNVAHKMLELALFVNLHLIHPSIHPSIPIGEDASADAWHTESRYCMMETTAEECRILRLGRAKHGETGKTGSSS